MSAAPMLHLSFPGKWHEIDLGDAKRTEASIRDIAVESCGSGDDTAKARILLREKLTRAVRAAREGEARSVYLGAELAPGVPLPVTVTVFEPSALRMSPAIGTDAEQVLAVLRQGLEGRFEEVADVEGGNFSALRTVTREAEERWYESDGEGADVAEAERAERACDPITAEADQIAIRRLRAEYWCHVPGTKSAVVVAFATDLSDIEQVLLILFDAMIGAAYFGPESAEAQAV